MRALTFAALAALIMASGIGVALAQEETPQSDPLRLKSGDLKRPQAQPQTDRPAPPPQQPTFTIVVTGPHGNVRFTHRATPQQVQRLRQHLKSKPQGARNTARPHRLQDRPMNRREKFRRHMDQLPPEAQKKIRKRFHGRLQQRLNDAAPAHRNKLEARPEARTPKRMAPLSLEQRQARRRLLETQKQEREKIKTELQRQLKALREKHQHERAELRRSWAPGEKEENGEAHNEL